MVREGEKKEWSIAGVNKIVVWLRPEIWCHPETHASVLKKSRERERGTSVWPLHRNEQDVWIQLSTSQTPLESKPSIATMSRSTYSIGWDKIYGCLCVRLPTYLCTSTDLYLLVRRTAKLVCQSMTMFDYVSWCVYINEIEMYVLICPCMCVCIRLFMCMSVYDGGGEGWRVENQSCSELLQSEPMWLPKKTVVGRVC